MNLRGEPACGSQEYLGHSSPQTTSIYTHLTVRTEELGRKAINQIMSKL